MSKHLKSTLRLFVVLIAALASFQVAFASGEALDQQASAEVESSAPQPKAAPVAQCANGDSDEIDFSVFDPNTAWGRQAMSCTYTCPNGMVALCPDRIDHAKRCINDCCYLIPNCYGYCNSHGDCAGGQICNGTTNCCVYP